MTQRSYCAAGVSLPVFLAMIGPEHRLSCPSGVGANPGLSAAGCAWSRFLQRDLGYGCADSGSHWPTRGLCSRCALVRLFSSVTGHGVDGHGGAQAQADRSCSAGYLGWIVWPHVNRQCGWNRSRLSRLGLWIYGMQFGTSVPFGRPLPQRTCNTGQVDCHRTRDL